MDTMIYLGLGKRIPTSSGGREACIISHLSGCTGVDTSMDECEVLSSNSVELRRCR